MSVFDDRTMQKPYTGVAKVASVGYVHISHRTGIAIVRRRMPLFAEARWAIACWMLGCILRLTEREASDEAIEAIGNLAERLKPDPKHETEWMRKRQ
ncbi:MAG: hypothetical protein AB7O57_04200 [Hyphomicrobiaceae bacterium]